MLNSEEKGGVKAKRGRGAFHEEWVTCAKAPRVIIQFSWRVGAGGWDTRPQREAETRWEGACTWKGTDSGGYKWNWDQVPPFAAVLQGSACALCGFNRVWLFITLPTVARQAPLSVGFSRREDWSELPCPSPGDLPDSGIEPVSRASPALQGILYCWATKEAPEVSDGSVTKSCPTLVTPWTVAHQAPLAIAFSRQEYWNGLPFPSPGDLPDPGIQPRSPALQADSLLTELANIQKTMSLQKRLWPLLEMTTRRCSFIVFDPNFLFLW